MTDTLNKIHSLWFRVLVFVNRTLLAKKYGWLKSGHELVTPYICKQIFQTKSTSYLQNFIKMEYRKTTNTEA